MTSDLVPPPPNYPPYVPPPAHPAPPVIAERVIYVHIPDPEPDHPTWAERLQPARNARCAAVAFIPATAWAHVLHQCATEQSLGGAWFLAAIPLAAAAVFECRGRWYARPLSWFAALGPALGLPALGSLVYLITGVTPWL